MQLPNSTNVFDVHQAVNMCSRATHHGCCGSEAPGGSRKSFLSSGRSSISWITMFPLLIIAIHAVVSYTYLMLLWDISQDYRNGCTNTFRTQNTKS